MNKAWKKTKIKKHLIVIPLAVLSVTALLNGCAASSAEDVAKDAAQAYIDGNASAYSDLLAPGYVDYMIGSGGWYDTVEEFQEDVIQDDIDELKDKFIDRCGENYSVAVTVTSVEPCEDEETLTKVQKELIKDYNYKEGDVTSVTQVEVKLRCTGNDTGGDIYHTYYCVKENGNWYIHRPDIDALS